MVPKIPVQDFQMKRYLICRVFFNISIICLLGPRIKAAPNFLAVLCWDKTSNYSINGSYHSNLKTLFTVLSSNATNITGFYSFTAGDKPPDIAYGFFLCRGDVTAEVCQECVTTAANQVVEKCPKYSATIWYDECMLRYANESLFSGFSTTDQVPFFSTVPSQTTFNLTSESGAIIMRNANNVTDPNGISQVQGDSLGKVASQASDGYNLGKKYAVGEAKYLSGEKLYSLAQCRPDVAASNCSGCLKEAIMGLADCCMRFRGARYLFSTCNIRFELYPFYNTTTAVPSSPSLPVAPTPPAGPTSDPAKKGGISSQLFAAIIVPTGAFALLFIAGLCLLTRRGAKKRKYDAPNEVVSEIDLAESLQYDLLTIQAATNNFSIDNKIGEGGFGRVYEGTFSNGQKIAVKRLSQNSMQGAQEFKNEVKLVAKLRHRNLVSLLGFCLEGEEKILVYEFVPNKSLDHFLFDPREREKLDWPTRYKIIGGIARGMLYLHEESRFKIIHRDLKISNILLDGDMNAKISDFGTARIFGVDQTQENTNRIVGTYGYMSPEYAMHGQFSMKSDVYSFGILVLEIICGKKNVSFYGSDYAEDLPSYAWKLWRDESPLELMDLYLEGSYSRYEVIRCIHIALLCVQDDRDARPSMATVVLMLNSHSFTMSIPQRPTFFAFTKTITDAPKALENSDKLTSNLMHLHVNEASITMPRKCKMCEINRIIV